MVCSHFHKTVITNAFKDIIHHGCVGNGRTAQAQSCVYYVISCYRLAVRPDRLIVNVYQKMFLVLCGNGVCQHGLKLHIGVQLHQRKKHQSGGIFIDLHAVHQEGIQGIYCSCYSHIYNLFPCGLSRLFCSCLLFGRLALAFAASGTSCTGCQGQRHGSRENCCKTFSCNFPIFFHNVLLGVTFAHYS